MDFFKGVGDFFGGLFGVKKKKKRVDSDWGGATGSWEETAANNQATPRRTGGRWQRDNSSFSSLQKSGRASDFSYQSSITNDNLSDLGLNFSNKNRLDGNRFVVGTGNSKVENTAVHEEDINDVVRKLGDRYHNEKDSWGRFWGGFTGKTDLKDRKLRNRLISGEMKKITDNLGKNEDGSFKRDYTDDEAYKMATLQLAQRRANNQRLKSFVPASTGKEGFGERFLGTAATIGNMANSDDGISSMVGNMIFGKQKSDEGFHLGRFVANLPTGMAAGVAGIGAGATDAISGKI